MGVYNVSYVIILIGVLILLFFVRMIVFTSKAQKKGKEIRKKVSNRANEFEHILALSGYFGQEGLPIPSQRMLNILLCNDKVVILDEANNFTIKKEQIKEVKYNAERKVEKELRTSTAKGVVGAAMFGTAGAVIGSQPKQKTVSDIIICDLCIKYLNSKGEDSIVKFSCSSAIGDKIQYNMKEFEEKACEMLLKNNVSSNGTIEL